MLPEFTRHDVASALDAIVESLLIQGSVPGPPINAIALAKTLAMTVAVDDSQLGRARLVRFRGGRHAQDGGAILLKTDPRPERMQWAVAHEIGEHYAHRVFQQLGASPTEAPANAREQVANALAGRILLPSLWFFDDARDMHWDLIELKHRYSTASHELISRRMLDGDPQIIISIFDNGRLTTRQTNLERRPPSPADLERSCWLAAHQTGVPQAVENRQISVQAWPVHEPEWKREILRTELLDQLDEC